MRVLVACEYTGVVRDAFIKRGHDAVSADYRPTEIEGNHYQGNVLDIIDEDWDLMIAHPPCTYLANSGVRWLHEKDGRWEKMQKAARFFKTLLEADIPMIAVENPIPHKYAVEIIGRKYDQIIHPYEFGHPETKATCLWLKNLPELKGTKNVKKEMERLPDKEKHRIHYMSPSKNRSKERSRTYKGVAHAMAAQWGDVLFW
jgi:hypothetical protein